MKKSFKTLNGIIIILPILLLCLNTDVQAQNIYSYDYGTNTGSLNSGTGTSPSIFSTPPAGTFFYGFSSGASGILKAENPGLLRLGTFTEAQASAGNGASEFTKFGIYAFEQNNYATAYNKFDVVLAGSTGTNYSNSGVWYFFAGDGGTSPGGKFMNANNVAGTYNIRQYN